jgi:hypothetical protein
MPDTLKTRTARTACVDGRAIRVGLGRFFEPLAALDLLQAQYEDNWAYGVAPDPVLQDMLAFSIKLQRESSRLSKELSGKLQQWEQVVWDRLAAEQREAQRA